MSRSSPVRIRHTGQCGAADCVVPLGLAAYNIFRMGINIDNPLYIFIAINPGFQISQINISNSSSLLKKRMER